MIKIRKVIFEDSELLLNWRNNPAVYKYALTPSPVTPADHVKWFAGALANPRCIFYMGLSDGIPCGSIRYQLTEDKLEAEVSISIAPEFWGSGLATTLMNLAESALQEETSVRVIHATVLNENKASMRLFEKQNFEPQLTKFKKLLK